MGSMSCRLARLSTAGYILQAPSIKSIPTVGLTSLNMTYLGLFEACGYWGFLNDLCLANHQQVGAATNEPDHGRRR